MMRLVVAAAVMALLVILTGCRDMGAKPGDYASLVNRSGSTGMKGNGSFAAGSDDHPGYVEFPISGGAQGAIAPSRGNHEAVTRSTDGLRGLGIANDSGGLGLGVH